ncbi:MAG TPA: Ig-like domain-containing protein [Candidatus Sulfomarinibacteraceae bacterium]|nr:Ig-like domain-containing protein [Candidatus Sulfomarinibacteraceae bacterium]
MRRLISFVSIVVALVALGLVLYNATVVDRRAPSVVEVSLSAPAGDERLAQTLTAIDIRFSEPVRASTVEARFRIDPYVAGAFAWDGPTAIYTPSAKLPPDTELTIWIEAGFEDLVGNVAELGLEPWVFRTVGPPAIVRASPEDGSTGLPVDGTVELEFDRLMDTASVEAAIRVDPPTAIRASWSGETVRLTFASQLRFGSTYALTIGVSAADTGGNRLRNPFTLHFSTVAAGLSVLGAVPADGASGIGVETPIAIRFDAPIDPDSARAAFRIIPSVTGEVRIVSVPDDRRPPDDPEAQSEPPDTILFVPDDPLAAHTTYAVTLAPTVARLDDAEAVAAGRSWTFTTGAPSVSAQNQITFLSVRSGVRNVWLMNPDGTNPRQLSTELAPVSGFDATADGALVAYSAGGIVSVVEVDGGEARRITKDGRFEYAPAFTPDDRWLIVGRRGPGGADEGYWLVPLPGTPGGERLLVDHGAPALGSADLGGEWIGGSDGTPAWITRSALDPTGRSALVVTAGGEPFIVDLGPASTAAPAVAVPLVADAAAAWSPRHGGFLVAAVAADDATSDGSSALWLITADGAIEPIGGTDGAVGPVGVGADGAIAVTLRRGDAPTAGIGILPAAATTLTRLNPADAFDDRWPAFSPAGGEVLFGRTSVAHPESADGIWIADLATGTARQLSTDGTYARWLP